MIHRLIHLFWDRSIAGGDAIFSTETEKKFKRSVIIVKLFYCVLFSISLLCLSGFSPFPKWHTLLSSEELFLPLWPVRWINLAEWSSSVNSIMLAFPLTTFLAVCAGTRYRFIRIAVFLSLFLYLALVSSFGKTDHYLHLFLLASFLFIFLPERSKKKEINQVNYLKIIWGLQLFILASYSASGLFKIAGIFYQLYQGQVSALSNEGLARDIAATEFISNHKSILGSMPKNFISPVFTFLLLCSYCIELVSVFIAFRPSWHRIWGILLILLHIFILLNIGPDFSFQVVLIALILVNSPFTPSRKNHEPSWKFITRPSRKNLRTRKN
ncbi:MAG: hypothetical protein HY064_09700 [Bacteroidetes bacterium]|nr:hypothetical protein [Bacteroidota bacterium]